MLSPMLAGATGIPPDPSGWVFEPKWDGVRLVARCWSGGLALASRRGNDVTAAYPELVSLSRALAPRAAVIDGEVVAFDDQGRPSFERLQRRMHARHPSSSLMAEVPVLYVAFDLLWLDGHLLTDEPLTERRRRLQELGDGGPGWQLSPMFQGAPDEDRMAACRKVGLEGYVGKVAASPYVVGRRSTAWTKIKCVRRREFVVGGWSEGAGGRSGKIGSLAIGWVDPEASPPPGQPFALSYAGQVGSGLNDLLLHRLGTVFAEQASDVNPFVGATATPALHFVRPTVVVEVQFNQVTRAGLLRQPSIKGLRDDVDPAEVGWTDELG